ncbi:2OG-Fe dioxygenase family protein [Piscirickettsia litoralis]|uniref:Biofilm formation and stress response factor family protein n=1 Tax=Piscirickettsia litoralis TaxID=1891921 RepID=A0ABX3A2H4_9GAMM|nr:2OG-Fe dioxygenase family protein [Piscirickettsia litoralis]ODN43067.1 biofilm formation and stress response factor family protein [Piscirickettsia litoralis]
MSIKSLVNPIINLFKFNEDFSSLTKYFEQLPVDPYVPGGYRHHGLSCFKYIDRSLWEKQPHKYIFQDDKTNPVAGGIKRQYPIVVDKLIQEPTLQLALQQFCDTINAQFGDLIDIHMLRTVTTSEQLGEAAPEGIHRDAVNHVGIFCINRHKVTAGETHIYTDKAGARPPVVRKILEPGEMLIIDDNEVFHFTDAVKPTDNEGYRDVFVFTQSTLMSL